nr:hypothetical protein [Tanacetum cinerariifolium]
MCTLKNIEEKIDIVLTWPSEKASLVIKGSKDANEDISVVEVSSAIDDVFDIGESNVESMEVRSEFSEFLENKENVEEVVVGGGKACRVGEDELNRVISKLMDGGGEFDGCLDEINLNLSEELADNYEKELVSVMLMGSWIMGVRSVTAWVAEGGRMYVQGSGRRKRKKVLAVVAEGRRTTGVEDETAVGSGYEISESRSILDITLRTRCL